MDSVISVGDNSDFGVIFTIGCLAFFMTWEAVWPRRSLDQSVVYRWANNFSVSLISYFISAYVTNVLLLVAAWQIDVHGIGLMQHVDLGFVPAFLIVLLTAQFMSYWLHRLFHIVPWLWRIHAVHHNDVDMDVATSYRHHPLEPVLPLPFVLPVYLLLGAPFEVIFAYNMVLIVATVFSHSNVYLPEKLDRFLRLFIITPDFHRNHHNSERRFTDSNYSTLVPWYDYLFGTATDKPFEEQVSTELGLEYLREPRDSRLDQLLLLPFKKWRR